MKISEQQIAARIKLQDAITDATNCGLFDILAAELQPDIINQFCDAVMERFPFIEASDT